MAQAPKFKIYDATRTYQAATKEPEAAACLVSLYGDGATVRFGHSFIVWHEGRESIPAGESYDVAAITMLERIEAVGSAAARALAKL